MEPRPKYFGIIAECPADMVNGLGIAFEPKTKNYFRFNGYEEISSVRFEEEIVEDHKIPISYFPEELTLVQKALREFGELKS
ncbi:hypothetical protein GOV13_04290 [Candidatus Pacearchaeota archaeon]|nr:hypothetical protein [Candidatus Pacearchaeota archaeon]